MKYTEEKYNPIFVEIEKTSHSHLEEGTMIMIG